VSAALQQDIQGGMGFLYRFLASHTGIMCSSSSSQAFAVMLAWTIILMVGVLLCCCRSTLVWTLRQVPPRT
jgi:hypothetical protein